MNKPNQSTSTNDGLKEQIYNLLYKNSIVDGVRIIHEDVWPIDELFAIFQSERIKAKEEILEEVLVRFERAGEMSKAEGFWTPNYKGILLSIIEEYGKLDGLKQSLSEEKGAEK